MSLSDVPWLTVRWDEPLLLGFYWLEGCQEH